VATFIKETGDEVCIQRVNVSAFTIPTDLPEADGTLRWDRTTIVIAEIAAGGEVGIGYTYADLSTAELIRNTLIPVIQGKDAMNTGQCYWAMLHRIRNLGHSGITAMAISCLDTALWDLKAKLLDVPLVTLLGGALRPAVPVYGSGGFTSYTDAQLERQLTGWAMMGIGMIKIKVGCDDITDLHRLYVARNALGKDVALFVDANGAYSRKQALAQAEQFARYDVKWFEEPVVADDLEGLRLMRFRAPATMEIAAGEYGYDVFYFRRMLETGAVDVLQADATRCGGFTGFLQAAELCNAHDTPLSAHTAPLLHTSIGCAARRMRHLEYFHDHVRIEKMLFDGVRVPDNGMLSPDVSRPGLGIELRRADAERYAA
jgi:L-alanine-DL-glutamate epimerase-like enolase superfamily enzyme